MIPNFNVDGLLPPGIHWATWEEISSRFGYNDHRKCLLSGLRRALISLKAAGCNTLYLDGSFVTNKVTPGDFDGCWDPVNVNPLLLDPVLLAFEPGRLSQKLKYGGELFVTVMGGSCRGSSMLDFFQKDKNSGKRKGIVALDLKGLV